MIEAGKILQDRYLVEKQIGQGGMGTVFVAVDQRFKSRVAVKHTFFDDPNLNKAFEREARLLNSLKHSALPKVNDFFTEGGSRFIVMEYIAGADLSEKMEKSGQAYPLEDVLNWGDQLCDALEYLHSQETPIIHRDIKPQNLKLTPKGRIILLDFGLAKGNPADSSHLTAAKSIFGYSRNYASLEQMQGTGTDPRSDLYSLAATLYHLAAGVPPADALTRAMNVLNDQPDPLIPAHLVDGRVPPGVADVLQQTMALNAAERPATAAEFRSLLADCDKSLAAAGVAAGRAAVDETDLLDQDTRLMSARTNVENPENAGIKTKILPGQVSPADRPRETNIAGEIETISSDPPATMPDEDRDNTIAAAWIIGAGKSRVAAAAGLLIVLVIGAASAVYLYNSQSYAESAPEAQIKPPAPKPGAKTGKTGSVLTEGNVPEELEETVEPVPVETPEVQTPSSSEPVKPVIRTVAEKASKKSGGTGNNDRTDKVRVGTYTTAGDATGESPERIELSDGKEKIVIDGDRIETESMIIEGDKVRLKKPGTAVSPKYPPPPRLTREQFRRLTPEQRIKLRKMQMLYREQLKKSKSDGQQPPKPKNLPPEKYQLPG